MGINIKSRPVELGYELRCCRPVAYDLTLCTLLGMGVKKLFDQGQTGCIVSTSPRADIQPVFLSDIEDKTTGKIPPRLVDIHSELAQLVFSDLHVIRAADYKAASKYLDNPEEYDFFKILKWEEIDSLRPA